MKTVQIVVGLAKWETSKRDGNLMGHWGLGTIGLSTGRNGHADCFVFLLLFSCVFPETHFFDNFEVGGELADTLPFEIIILWGFSWDKRGDVITSSKQKSFRRHRRSAEILLYKKNWKPALSFREVKQRILI